MKSKKPRFSQARLKELMHYNPQTGVFVWLVSPARCVKAGDIAGSTNSEGYTVIGLFNRGWMAHLLAWYYMTGYWPTADEEVDHRDTNQGNNAFSNLRLDTTRQNAQNASMRSDNTSGFKGVSRIRNKWQARVSVKGVSHYLGVFSTREEAGAAAKAKRDEMHKEFARHV
jgi:hypothetical protein